MLSSPTDSQQSGCMSYPASANECISRYLTPHSIRSTAEPCAKCKGRAVPPVFLCPWSPPVGGWGGGEGYTKKKKKKTNERKPLGPCRNWIALLHVNSRGSLPFPFSRQYSQVGLLTQLDMLLATGGSVSFLQPLHPPTLLALCFP